MVYLNLQFYEVADSELHGFFVLNLQFHEVAIGDEILLT